MCVTYESWPQQYFWWPLSDYYILKVVRACGRCKKKVVGLNPTWSNFLYEIAKLWLKINIILIIKFWYTSMINLEKQIQNMMWRNLEKQIQNMMWQLIKCLMKCSKRGWEYRKYRKVAASVIWTWPLQSPSDDLSFTITWSCWKHLAIKHVSLLGHVAQWVESVHLKDKVVGSYWASFLYGIKTVAQNVYHIYIYR